jgi:hypothetical protein
VKHRKQDIWIWLLDRTCDICKVAMILLFLAIVIIGWCQQ